MCKCGFEKEAQRLRAWGYNAQNQQRLNEERIRYREEHARASKLMNIMAEAARKRNILEPDRF